MRKTKSFIQYSNDSFSIVVRIKNDGTVSGRNIIYTNTEYKKNKKKEYKKLYGITNKNEIKEYNKKWYNDNIKNINEQKERRNKRTRLWRKNNSNKIKKDRENNKEKINAYSRQWSKNNPDKIRKYRSNRRKYGFNPLNNYFKGSHFHHLHIDNHNDGIFIPENIHNGIWHNCNNKESMIKINKIAFEWLEKQGFKI